MKKIYTLLIGIFSTAFLYSQVPGSPPEGFSFKATIIKANGAIVASKTISLRISILQGNTDGLPVYSNVFYPKTSEYGQIDVIIGEDGGLHDIAWEGGPFFLKTEFDEKGGTNFITLSITQLLSVPYALYSGSATSASRVYYNDLIGIPNLSLVATSGIYDDLSNLPSLFDGSWYSLTDKPNDLSGYGISDAMSTLHPSNNITSSNITNWNTAFDWGNHAEAGYLKNFTETDPIFTISPAKEITGANITNWNDAFNWGDHNLKGYASLNGIENLTNKTLTSPIINSPTGLVKADVGLREVDNTPDLLKPISAATQAALELKESLLTFQNPLGRTANIIFLPGASNLSDGYMSIADKTKLDGLHNADGSETLITAGDNVNITGIGTSTDPYKVNVPGVITGSLNLSRVLSGGNDAGSSKISNLGDPEADHDAATKAYVDELRTLVEALTQRISVLEGESNNSIMFNPNLTYSTVTDIEGNIYKSIQIGTQIWMAENLRTTKFNDETDIPLLTGSTDSPGYFWYNNDQSTYGEVYGALYNWQAMNTGKLCPQGWHAPSYDEWTILTDYLGGLSASGAGGKLKEIGTTHWNSPNTAATNESGFTALPSGYSTSFSSFGIGDLGVYGSTTLDPDPSVAVLALNYSNEGSPIVYKWGVGQGAGVAVRCVKDDVSPEFDNDHDGHAVNGGDCDDNNPNIHPGATEIPGNDIDEDCNGFVSCFIDGDNDGYGSTSIAIDCYPAINGNSLVPGVCGSSKTDGLDETASDCTDYDPRINPGAPEICDGKDNDCDLAIDEDLNAPLSALQIGVCNGMHKVCGGTNGWQEPDYSLLIASYEATETTCDGKDNDCDGQVDEDCSETIFSGTARYIDFATILGVRCGYPVPGLNRIAFAAISPDLYNQSDFCGKCIRVTGPEGSAIFKIVDQIGDCQTLHCSLRDLDLSYEGFDLIADPSIGQVQITWELVPCQDDGQNLDKDGYSIPSDCNDVDPTIYPGATEICGDGIDQDCNGADESCVDPNANWQPGNPWIDPQDGSLYKTAMIGTQAWMVEELKATKLNDGTEIPYIPDDIVWSGLTTPGYCWKVGLYEDIHILFYNWYTINTGKLCPSGFHIPTENDWQTLLTYIQNELGAPGEVAASLRTNNHPLKWVCDATEHLDIYGFEAVPSGFRLNDGSYNYGHSFARYWSTTPSRWDITNNLATFEIDCSSAIIGDSPKNYGNPVRCIKD